MEKITIYTAGAAKGNPGPAAIGVYAEDSKGNPVLEISESIGNATSEYAEYYSVARGFQLVKEKFEEKTREIQFELKQENELVHKHLNADAQINDVSLIGHFIEIYNIRVSHFHNLILTKISHKENTTAQHLVARVLDV